jgi:diphthamide biosynthesis methyltransferase
MKLLVSLVFAPTLLVAVAYGQTASTTTTPSTGGTSDAASTNITTTATTETRGTVVEYTPGASLVLATGSGEPLHYRFGKTVTYLNDEGRTIDPARIKKNYIVRVHYTKEGNDMIIDKVILSD